MRGNAGPGHNSGVAAPGAERLRSLVERIERLQEERKALASDIRDIYVEAKSAGYDVKVLASSSSCAGATPPRSRKNALLDIYVRAIG